MAMMKGHCLTSPTFFLLLQAHVVNEDEDEDMDNAHIQELDQEGQKEGEKRAAASSNETAPRPDLEHQPEIVESPKSKGVEFRSSTEVLNTEAAAGVGGKET